MDFLWQSIEYLYSLDINRAWLVVEWIMADAFLLFAVLSCLVPVFLLIFLFSAAVALRLYIYRSRVIGMSSQQGGIRDRARTLVATVADTAGAFMHGFDVDHFERIPDRGGALLVLYHGALPLDFYYLWAKVQLGKRRAMYMVADRFLWKIPGIGVFLDVLHAVKGTREECASILKDDHLVVVSPGGLREAQFSDSMYKVLWGKRSGFARVAKEANVPIIPVFCRNIRQAVHTFPWKAGLLRRLYEFTRLPVVPIYGVWPVKLRCYIGEPMTSPDGEDAEEYAHRVRVALENIIEEHQDMPGSTGRALQDRFTMPPVKT